MKKASEYRQHAQECRALAKQLPEGAQRSQLLEMARTWDALSETRETKTRKPQDAQSEHASRRQR